MRTSIPGLLRLPNLQAEQLVEEVRHILNESLARHIWTVERHVRDLICDTTLLGAKVDVPPGEVAEVLNLAESNYYISFERTPYVLCLEREPTSIVSTRYKQY